jgi:hypothetical protein
VAANRVTVAPKEPADRWTPPGWHGPPSDDDRRAHGPPPAARPLSRPASRRQAASAARFQVLELAVAPAAIGILALGLSVARPLSGSGDLPIALLLLAALEAVCVVVTRSAAAALARSWLVCLVTTAGMLPLLTLQSSLLHEPYVALSRHSAAPAILASAVATLAIAVLAIWCGIAFWSTPEEASLVFLPPALLAPAVLGIRTTIHQRTALEALGEASLLAAGALVLAWSLPAGTRAVVPPAAYALQYFALWATGHGPAFPVTSGRIVVALYLATIGVTALAVIGLPIFAAWLRRAALAIENSKRPRRSPTGEGTPPP